jgi:hypothetical protein
LTQCLLSFAGHVWLHTGLQGLSGSVSPCSDGSSSPVCPCSGSLSLGQGREVLCRSCAGLRAGGVCKTCSDGPGIAPWKIFWICDSGVRDRQSCCQHSHSHLDLAPGCGQKYRLSWYPDSELQTPVQGVNRSFLPPSGGTDSYARYLGHRRVWKQQAGPVTIFEG